MPVMSFRELLLEASKPKKERCLFEEFIQSQDNLPPEKRKDHAMISCPCSKCSPGKLAT